MNSSFSILQKLKTQFLQSVPRPGDYHVAFAPFAFTLSSDDFYFLRTEAAATGDEARKYLRAQSEFAILANSVLRKPHLWTLDGEHLLYNLYRQVLDEALLIAPGELTAAEKKQLDKAKAVLFTATGKDSAKYKRYKKYAADVATTEQQLLDHQVARAAIADTDTAAVAKWDFEHQAMQGRRNDLLIEWQAKGYKSAVDAAKATYDQLLFGKERFVQAWQEAKGVKMAPPNLLTDDTGVEFYNTGCVPNALWNPAAAVWRKLSLGKADIATLAEDFARDVPVEVAAAFGAVEPALDGIDFEYCFAEVQRPWFDDALLCSRNWSLPPGQEPVSAGDDTLGGQWPAYPVKIILARNINLVFTPNSAVNDDIKNQLRLGGRLMFGPLLLKTIPTNLPDDRITGLRIQAMTKPEMAVLAQVSVASSPAVSSAALPVASTGRLQMLQAIHQNPQALSQLRVTALRPEVAESMVARDAAARPLGIIGTLPMGTFHASVPVATHVAEAVSVATPAQPASAADIGKPPILMHPVPFPGHLFPLPNPATPEVPPSGPASPPVPPPQPITSVSGKVRAPNGSALAVAEVQITNTANAATQSVLTGDDGSYSLLGIEAAHYQLQVRKSGYVTITREVDLRGASLQDFLLPLEPLPVESFQVIGMVCRKLPKLPDPWPGAVYK